MPEPYDVLLLGGGPAGMSAALPLGRARLRVLVLNAETPRSGVTHATHNFYTRDGVRSLELLDHAKAQLATYPTVDYRVGKAVWAARAEGGFTVTASDGRSWTGRRLVVATGFRTAVEPLGIEGLAPLYGRSVFPCPFCDGYELADRRLAIFVGGMAPEMVAHFLPMVRSLSSPDLVVFSHGTPLGTELRDALKARGIPAYEDHIARLHADGDQLTGVELADGTVVEVGAGFLGSPHSEPSTNFAVQLGAKTTTNPFGWPLIDTEERGATGIDGLYVAGDARSGFTGIAVAASQGFETGAGIVAEIAQQRWHG